ncbi:hypothetical protein [Deinococcus cellulosilyticus]|uniref:hypothetical protein n=1 Tax=Deinococcus cellulosilyticus TaxID=401558 RepID=UPI0011BFAF4C|nr:hypothetical protein [Deinococcus cellulosilyticus]
MPDLLAHQQQYPGKWQPEAGPDGKASFWLPIWVQGERQPDLGLDDLGNWVVPTGDGLIPAQLRSVLLLPLLHLERDAFEKQLSARLEALKLPVLPLVGTPGFSGVLRVASDRRSVAFWHC